METIRTFIAIDLSPEAVDAITALQQRLKPKMPGVGWTTPQNMHLTLHFLGHIATSQVEAVQAAMAAATRPMPGFTLTVTGLGSFPNERRPKVVWAGVGGQRDALMQLQTRLGQHLTEAIGFEPEARPYSPHLTLGRTRKNASAQQLSQLGAVLVREQANVGQLATLEVMDICLMQSELKSGGPIYTRLVHSAFSR